MNRYFIFLLHLFNGTVATMIGGMLLRKFFVSIHSAVSGNEHIINFEIQSFWPCFALIGFIAGYMSYVRVGGSVAFWIWTIPVAVLLIRLTTFHSPTVFESGFTAASNYFFGEARCSAHTPLELAGSANKCLNRMIYFGLIWSAIAYSAGAFVSSKDLWPTLSMFIRRSGAPR